jgi:hypothetical protein
LILIHCLNYILIDISLILILYLRQAHVNYIHSSKSCICHRALWIRSPSSRFLHVLAMVILFTRRLILTAVAVSVTRRNGREQTVILFLAAWPWRIHSAREWLPKRSTISRPSGRATDPEEDTSNKRQVGVGLSEEEFAAMTTHQGLRRELSAARGVRTARAPRSGVDVDLSRGAWWDGGVAAATM